MCGWLLARKKVKVKFARQQKRRTTLFSARRDRDASLTLPPRAAQLLPHNVGAGPNAAKAGVAAAVAVAGVAAAAAAHYPFRFSYINRRRVQ